MFTLPGRRANCQGGEATKPRRLEYVGVGLGDCLEAPTPDGRQLLNTQKKDAKLAAALACYGASPVSLEVFG